MLFLFGNVSFVLFHQLFFLISSCKATKKNIKCQKNPTEMIHHFSTKSYSHLSFILFIK